MAGKIVPRNSINTETCQDRRFLLKLGFATATTFAIPTAFADALKQPERKISLLNLHTGEHLKATYWAEGHYQKSELQAINHVLRDYRTGDVQEIDSNLIELLNLLHHKAHGKQPFHVISGYRSPKTNAMLRQTSSGVAKKSLHMLGKAIDIRLPGRQLSELRKMAMNMKVGGVGFYPGSDFIHVDTGRVRYWKG